MFRKFGFGREKKLQEEQLASKKMLKSHQNETSNQESSKQTPIQDTLDQKQEVPAKVDLNRDAVEEIVNDTNWDEVMGLIDDDLAKLDRDLELCDEEEDEEEEEHGSEVKCHVTVIPEAVGQDFGHSSEVSHDSTDSGITAVAVEVVGSKAEVLKLDDQECGESHRSRLGVDDATSGRQEVEGDVILDTSPAPTTSAVSAAGESHSISPCLDEVSVSSRVVEYERSTEDLRRKKKESFSNGGSGSSRNRRQEEGCEVHLSEKGSDVNSGQETRQMGRRTGARGGAPPPPAAVPSTSSSCRDICGEESRRRDEERRGDTATSGLDSSTAMSKSLSYRDVVNDATYQQLHIPEVAEPTLADGGGTRRLEEPKFACSQSASCRSVPRQVDADIPSNLTSHARRSTSRVSLARSTRSLASSTYSAAASSSPARNPIKTGSSRSLSSYSRQTRVDPRLPISGKGAGPAAVHGLHNQVPGSRRASQKSLARSLQDIGGVKVMLTSSNDPDRGSAVYTQVKRRNGNDESVGEYNTSEPFTGRKADKHLVSTLPSNRATLPSGGRSGKIAFKDNTLDTMKRNAFMIVATGKPLDKPKNASPQKPSRSLPRLGVSSVNRSRPQSAAQEYSYDDVNMVDVHTAEKKVTFEPSEVLLQDQNEARKLARIRSRKSYRDFNTVVISIVWMYTVFSFNFLRMMLPRVISLSFEPVLPPSVIRLGDTFMSVQVSQEQTDRPLAIEALACTAGAWTAALLLMSRYPKFNIHVILALGCAIMASGLFMLSVEMLNVNFGLHHTNANGNTIWLFTAWSSVYGVGRGVVTVVTILTSLKLWSDHSSGTTMLAVMFALSALVSACSPYLVQPFVTEPSGTVGYLDPLIKALRDSPMFSGGGNVKGTLTNFTSSDTSGDGEEVVVGVVRGGIGRGLGGGAIAYSALFGVMLCVGFGFLFFLHVASSIRRKCFRGGQLAGRKAESLKRDEMRDFYAPDACNGKKKKNKKNTRKSGGVGGAKSRRGQRRGARIQADVVRARDHEDNDEAEIDDNDHYADNDLHSLVPRSSWDSGARPKSGGGRVGAVAKGRACKRSGVTVDRTRCLLRRHTGGPGTLIYLYVFFALPYACETLYARYSDRLAPWSTNDGVQGPHAAATSRAVFYAAICASRLFAAVACRYVQPNFLVLGHLSLGVGSSVILAVYGTVYTPIHFAFTALLGWSVGVFVPAGFTWANSVLAKSPLGVTLAVTIGSLGVSSASWLVAVLVDWRGMSWVATVVAALLLLATAGYPPLMRHVAKGKVAAAKTLSSSELVFTHSLQNYV